MKHTPGPWGVNTATDSFGWVNHAINWGRNYGEEENQANARLIAAAPELLEALIDVLEACDGLGPCDCGASSTCAICKAQAAIAKAKGE